MSKLSRSEVEHVAFLAKLRVNDEKIKQYQVELGQLLDSVEQIKEVHGYDDDIIIAPFSREAELRSDVEGEMLSSAEVLKNVPRKSGNFIEVPVVIHE